MTQLHSIVWQYLLPHHALSRLTGRLANSKWPWLKDFLIQRFIQHYGVDMRLAQESDPSAYETFNAFFTRALKPGVRSIALDKDAVACPVDGCVSQVGDIRQGRIFQAKGFDFGLTELLGGSELSDSFMNGQFATFYLAPKGYHRVHMPVEGTLKEMRYIPGRLFSVNAKSVDTIPQLFSRNERVVAFFDTAYGPMAVVLVGAMIVASIETVWAGLIAPDRNPAIQTTRYLGAQVCLKKGEEMGRFQLGSTVIVLFASPGMRWGSEMVSGAEVVLGQEIARRSL